MIHLIMMCFCVIIVNGLKNLLLAVYIVVGSRCDAGDRFLRVFAGHDTCYRASVSDGLACELARLASAAPNQLAEVRGALLLEWLPVLQLIMLDELKNDYRNPVDFCQNLNRVYFVKKSSTFSDPAVTVCCCSWYYQSMAYTLA